MLAVDAISTGVSYGTSEICQAMGCPGGLTLVLSLLAGMGTSAGLGSEVFKRPHSSLGKMSDGDGIRYTQYWDDVEKGLDTQTRVKLNQWNYRPNADLYNKYKNVFDNPKYYNQETGAINWPDNRGV